MPMENNDDDDVDDAKELLRFAIVLSPLARIQYKNKIPNLEMPHILRTSW